MTNIYMFLFGMSADVGGEAAILPSELVCSVRRQHVYVRMDRGDRSGMGGVGEHHQLRATDQHLRRLR